jgi:hypothetical protein
LLEPDMDSTSKALSCLESDQWGPDSDNSICETPVLELKSILGEGFISKLYEEVSGIITDDPKFEESVGNISNCCCLIKSIGKVDFCPMAKEVMGDHIGHFGFHWMKGEPVIVRDVLKLASGLSWDPMVMWRVLRDKHNSGQESKQSALAVDCRDWSDVSFSSRAYNISFFQTKLNIYYCKLHQISSCLKLLVCTCY